MKFTALALEFMGVMIAGFAGYQYFLYPPVDPVEGHFTSSGLGVLLLGFAVALMTAGAAMLVFGGKGYSVSDGAFWRRRR